MSSWAERMIVIEVQEKSRIKQEEIVFRDKIAKEKKHEANVLAMRLFSSYKHIGKERFWNFIAYTYFICKTLGLFILIDMFILKRPSLTLFMFIFLSCYYFSLKFNKSILRKKIKEIA